MNSSKHFKKTAKFYNLAAFIINILGDFINLTLIKKF